MIAIADTSFVLAYANERDNYHRRCLEVHQKQRSIDLPQSTLAEIAYMLGREKGNISESRKFERPHPKGEGVGDEGFCANSVIY